MLATYINANFNNMFETLTFQQSYSQYLYSLHIHKQIINSVGSSSEYYLQYYLKTVDWNALRVFVFVSILSLKQSLEKSDGFGTFGGLKYNLLVKN